MIRRTLCTALSAAILVLAAGCGQSPTAPEIKQAPTPTAPSFGVNALAAG